MLDRPEYWQSHYHGDGNARRLARGYSYSDRVRYYWPDSQIDDAFAHLVRNLADSPIRYRSSAVSAAAIRESSLRRAATDATGTHYQPYSGHPGAVPHSL